jgi:hypothetical protein
MRLSAGWSGRLAGTLGGGIKAKAGSANVLTIKAATGDIIAGLTTSLGISIFLRFFISNLGAILLEESQLVPISKPNFAFARLQKVEAGQPRVMTSGTRCPECANLLKSADGGAVWAVSESASAHSRTRAQHHHPQLDFAFQDFDGLARTHLLALRKVWPFVSSCRRYLPRPSCQTGESQ